ncbi:efflux RND transporter permease subunit [Terasakiella sp. A23]|uniref:efflux RND transporter permease subunit n=1 Tax=Terasakiella sp. FCG-A23 TaxID=3080561 RepID=UPI0029557812|nr:efflux RND transporter permease subunit [Terasakiella sp. A23]MDV7340100.1 efflux RND transporter permease subunit [Terasakiella sp. A23]
MKNAIEAALGHARTVLLTLALILITGTVAYNNIPKESDPDINIPIIYVVASHDGISPEDAERLIIRPLEQELRTIEGIKEMRSTGYEGGGNVTLEFEAGFDADKALDDVREKVDLAKSELPDETDEPTVHEVNFSLFPVLVVTLAGDVPERTLVKVARDLQDSIESIPTVLEAEIAGDRDEMVEIVIDPAKVELYGLTPADAINAVGGSNRLVAAGSQDTGQGRFAVKVPGLYETVFDIMNQPLKVDGDAVVTLGDIAEVRRTFKDPVSFARVNGSPAIALEVSKRTGENIIETIERVREIVAVEQEAWPDTLKQNIDVSFSQDRSNQIRTMLLDLQNNVLSAILLVMVVVVAALGMRTAGLVGMAIPGSFLAGILVLSAMDMTLNIVVLFSLILAVGMLVDGAVVVTEYADRKMIEGLHRRKAYGLAAQRMAWPITASTATTLAAFLPLLFWPGVVGEFMKFMPITLIATLSASLLMALIFVPTLGSLFGKASAAVPELSEVSPEKETDLSNLHGITGTYIGLLQKALRHPAKILFAAFAMLIGVQITYANFGKGVEFFPEIEPENAIVQVRARGNLSVWEQKEILETVESRILPMSEFKTIYTRIGAPEQSEEAEDIIGTVSLEFKEWHERRPANVILAEIKDMTADIPGIEVDARKQEEGPPTGKPINLQLSSRNTELLAPAVAQIRAGLEQVDGLLNLEDSRPLPGIDWELDVDRAQASKFGANIGLVGDFIQMTTSGLKLGEYRPDDTDDEVEIRARFPKENRTIDQLQNIRINSEAGTVPISNFVSRTAEQRTGKVNRIDGFRVMAVKADVEAGINVDAKLNEIKAWLKDQNIDPRIKIEFKGEDEEQRKAEEFLVNAFGVALFIMAIILVTQFNSFYSAFLILSAVIMSTIGVFIGLMITAQPFGIVMGGVGVIALAGIVVNNNIVLIDTFDRLKHETGSAYDAIVLTGAQRMRPVLLTTVTTMLGLLPMVLQLNIDFFTREITSGAPSTQWWVQLATAIFFGLGFATVLTLVVTPSALMLRANVQDWFRNRKAAKIELAE